MINSVGGSQMNMMMPGMQRLPGNQQQRPTSTGGAAASEEVDNSMPQRAPAQRTSEPAPRAMTEARGMFVDCYA